MVDLPIILNLSEQIPALRRVRALDQLLMQDLPPLGVGATLSGELRLCDGDGAILAESGNAAYAPVALISRFNAGAQETLALVSSFTLITQDPKGWSFALELTSEELIDYIGTDGESKEAIFEISMAGNGRLIPLYRRAVTLLPLFSNGSTPTPSPALNSPQLKPAITTAAQHRAVVTAGAVLPLVYLTLEDGAWSCWTLRARGIGEDDDGTSYRVPDDYNASTNNVIWVKTSLA